MTTHTSNRGQDIRLNERRTLHYRKPDIGQLTGVALIVFALCFSLPASAQELVLSNNYVRRVLTFDGHVWRTTLFARADGSGALPVQSDGFKILLFDDRELTLDQYQADGSPVWENTNGVQQVSIHYVLRTPVTNAPAGVTMTYTLGDEPCLRKTVRLEMNQGDSVDRLEVERFSVSEPASRGGRGEPVFVGTNWFFGMEYPAFYSRRTDGNTPAAGTGPYDHFGNYSEIDLAGRDIDDNPRAGLIRLIQFPGYAKQQPDGSWGIVSKTAVAGVRIDQPTLELAFVDYFHTVSLPVRSFLYYNNWFDSSGKSLTLQNFVTNVFFCFKTNLAPYGVSLDAMMADDGWENKQSVFQPNPSQFPNGMSDLAALGEALKENGTHLGLWIALNGYGDDTNWGVTHGYELALRNSRFQRFKPYFSLSASNYNAAINEQSTNLVIQGQLDCFKLDFNDLCDMAEGHGFPPTDRHGHEAQVDAEIDLLARQREANKKIYQNITNWIWFTPWWLMNGNSLWMLASDSSVFKNLPELSVLITAAAYRDVNLYQVWGNPDTRPLVPLSRLMTHGIIYTTSSYGPNTSTNSLRDFADYVMMYYMRGVQLKEWYITPGLLTSNQWEVLGRATHWSETNVDTLANTVMVGGDPAQGQVYGYVAWNGDSGFLSVRNPSPGAADITVPFDASVWYRGAAGIQFHAKVIYPYQAEWPDQFTSGQPIHITVPGYSVMIFQLQPGPATGTKSSNAPPVFTTVQGLTNWQCSGALPDETMQRCDLLVITPQNRPQLKLNGNLIQPARTNAGNGWLMTAYDLRDFTGMEVHLDLSADGDPVKAWMLMDRPVPDAAADSDPALPDPVAQGFRRQTVLLFDSTNLPPNTPANLTAGAISSSRINLSWTPAIGASGYIVKRATVTGGPYDVVVAGIAATNYVDTGLSNSTTYYYVLSATNAAGESSNSAEAVATTPAPALPDAPAGLAAVPGNMSASLNWVSSPEAATYNVKRSTNNGGPYATIASNIVATAYTDTSLLNGATYYYVVSGVNVVGEGPDSEQAAVAPNASVIAHWSFDSSTLTESGGDITAIADSTGHHNMVPGANIGGADGQSGSRNSSAVASSQSVSGRFGQALTLNSGNFLMFSNLTELMAAAHPAGYTVSFWVNTTDAVSERYAYGLSDWGNAAGKYTYGFALDRTADPGDLRAQARNSSNADIYTQSPTAPGPLTNGVWHMLTWTFDTTSGVLKTYVDGLLVDSHTSTGDVQIANNPSLVGAVGLKGDYSGDGISGSATFDEIWIYNGVLNTNQIAGLYHNNSLPGSGLAATRPEISSMTVSGSTLTITGTNGSSGDWALLQSTNLALPLGQWRTSRIITFDPDGSLSTNFQDMATNHQAFYILKQ